MNAKSQNLEKTGNETNIIKNDVSGINNNTTIITKISEPKFDTNQNIRIIPFFISEYGFFLTLLIIFYVSTFIQKYHSPKIFISKKAKSFNSDYTPEIFLHISDIHLTNNNPLRLDGSLIFLNSVLNYNPDLILLTGDMVDNFKGKRNWARIGIQSNEDWVIFNKTAKKMFSKFPVIDIAGNHDVWSVESVTSLGNFFLNYSFMFNRSNVHNDDDFTIKRVKMFNKIFILFNDFIYPTPRPPYISIPYTNKHNLDLLENAIDELNGEECYILFHYSTDRMWYIKSSKGHTFEEIISKKNVAALFTGHNHPDTLEIIHHGEEGGLEYCISSTFDKKRAGLITIDNDNLVYHEVNIPYPGEEPKFFMTYPVPNEQISNHVSFNLYKFEIRVLSFVNEKDITLKIEGDINGELKYLKTLKNGANLYSYSVNKPPGSYIIHIYDENGYSCNITREFTVGKEYQGVREKALNNLNFYLVYRFSSIIFIIYLLIILVPFYQKCKIRIIENIEKYIHGKEIYKKIPKIILYIIIIFLSPFLLGKRFHNINKILKITIYFSSIYPLILPLHFFETINGKPGFILNVFVVIGYTIRYNHISLQMTYNYYLLVIYPFVVFLSGIKYYNKQKHIKTINYIMTVILFFLASIFNFFTMAQSLSLIFLFFSTGYIINWFLIFTVSCIYLNKNKLKSTKNILLNEESLNKFQNTN